MKLKPKNHSGDTIFSVLLLLIFTMFTLMLAGTGAAVYKNSTTHLNENYTSRTAIAYISEKVRQHNSAGDIFFSEVEGNAALVLREAIEEETFLTYIYHYDGALCELFVREDTVPMAQSGSRIVELESLEIVGLKDSESKNLNENLSDGTAPVLSVTATSPEGHSLSMLIHYCKDL